MPTEEPAPGGAGDAAAGTGGTGGATAAPEDAGPGQGGGGGGGGSPLDAGTRDVRPGESASDAFFGAPRCKKGGSLMCDDFESGALDSTLWTWSHESATGKVEDARAARGRYSFHVNLASMNGNPWNFGVISTKMSFPVAKNRLFIRAFLFFDKNTPNRHTPFLMANATEKAPDGGDWNYGLEMDAFDPKIGGGRMVLREFWNHQVGYGPSQDGSTKELAPIGEWACWEWELRGTTNELYLNINERPINSMTVPASKGWLAPPRATVDLGLRTSHLESLAPGGFDVWIDEVQISNTPIGCTM